MAIGRLQLQRVRRSREWFATLRFRPKLLIMVAVCVSLAALFLAAAGREWSSNPKAAKPRTIEPTRPPLSTAEEEYITKLWPIHGEVERSTAVMSLGEIFFLNKDPDMTTERFKRRVDAALKAYDLAEQSLRAISAPASLGSKHEQYLAAVLLLRESAQERLRLFADGDISHLHAAYRPLQNATDTIRQIGSDYWPNEFVPH